MSKSFSHMGLRSAAVTSALALMVAGLPVGPLGADTSAQAGVDAFQDGQGRGGGRGGGRGQVRDNQNTPIGAGTIRGGVYSYATGAPVRRAQVRLTSAEIRGGRAVTTNDDGTFEFVALPAGRYTLTATKPGFVNNAYGARSPGRPGTPIQLAEGQTMEKANISLPRGSVITGIVVDDNGEPSPGTQVRVMRFAMRSGERSVQQAGLDTTDDRGMYRVYGLQPGDYLVSAIPRNQNFGDLRQAVMQEVEALLGQTGAARGGRGGFGALGAVASGGGNQALIERAAELQAQLQTQDETQNVAYAPVFYPGTASPSSASSVTIGIGEERVGVDFQLQLVQTAQVTGQVVAFDGTLPQGVQVSLVPADRGGFASLPGMRSDSSRVDQNGEFSFENVTPGQYSLQARATIREVDPNAPEQPQGRGGRGRGGRGGGPISQVLWAAMDVSVSGTDLSGMVLNLQPGMTVEGQLQFNGSLAGVPQDLSNARVTLSPRGPQSFEIGGVPPAQVDATGRFTITGIAPGHYTLSANVNGGGRGGRGGEPQPAVSNVNWVLSSARVAGVEALDFPFEVAPNQNISGAQVVFTDRTQSVAGTLQDASGRPIPDFTIVVYPTDERYWLPQARRITATRPDTDGRFRFNNLPPGNYRMAAIIDAEPGEWYNPDFLRQLEAASMVFSLTEGEAKVQDIRLAGGF